MRYSRQNKILDIISKEDVDTQEKLVQLLKESGYEVTQATISRDIKELQLVKTQTANGRYKYIANRIGDSPVTDRFVKIFRETITSVDYAENNVIIKTLSGCANAAAEAIDTSNFPHIKGSIAGDNTILLIVDKAENSESVVNLLNDMLIIKPKKDVE